MKAESLNSFLNPKEIISLAVSKQDDVNLIYMFKVKTMFNIVTRLLKACKKGKMSLFKDIPESLLLRLDSELFNQFDLVQSDVNRFIICFSFTNSCLLKKSKHG